MKVEQEGERLNKVLNDIENKLVQIKNKPTRYFQMIRDLKNKILSDDTYFEKKIKKEEIVKSNAINKFTRVFPNNTILIM